MLIRFFFRNHTNHSFYCFPKLLVGLSSASADREGVVGVIITIGFLGENEFILIGFLPLFLSSVDDLRFCWTEDKNTTIFWIWLLLAEFCILMIYSLATSVKNEKKK